MPPVGTRRKAAIGIAAGLVLLAIIVGVAIAVSGGSTSHCSAHTHKDPASGACVACTDHGHCGSGRLCDPATHTCVLCIHDGDCASGSACAPDGTCGAKCTPNLSGVSAECTAASAGRPACHATAGTCVACATDAQCARGFTCDAAQGTCVECTGDHHCSGHAVCASGHCALACTADGDCTDPAAPACVQGACRAGVPLSTMAHPSSSVMVASHGMSAVACASDGDCPGPLSICAADRTCTHAGGATFRMAAQPATGGNLFVAVAPDSRLVLVTAATSVLTPVNMTALTNGADGFALLVGDASKALRLVEADAATATAPVTTTPLADGTPSLTYLPRTLRVTSSAGGGALTTAPTPSDTVKYAFAAAGGYLAPDAKQEVVVTQATPYMWHLHRGG